MWNKKRYKILLRIHLAYLRDNIARSSATPQQQPDHLESKERYSNKIYDDNSFHLFFKKEEEEEEEKESFLLMTSIEMSLNILKSLGSTSK